MVVMFFGMKMSELIFSVISEVAPGWNMWLIFSALFVGLCFIS